MTSIGGKVADEGQEVSQIFYPAIYKLINKAYMTVKITGIPYLFGGFIDWFRKTNDAKSSG